MRKKNTIRLNESELKSIVKESVKTMVNEISHSAVNAYHKAVKNKRKYGKDVRVSLIDERLNRFKELDETRTMAFRIWEYLKYLNDDNPRINKQYLKELMHKCYEIIKALNDNGPIADAIMNQLSNNWKQPLKPSPDYYTWNEPDGKPYKARDIWEPRNYDEEK